jgi:ArsR family transcriptional regulator, virulence genes transcriptional regulator
MKNSKRILSPSKMAASADHAAALLRALSNENRLLILCHLIAAGELSVGQIVERVGLSQSALSQHLAKLRQEGLVVFRREAQTIFYRVADERAGKVLEVLYDIFCADLGGPAESGDSRTSVVAAVRDKRAVGE